MAKLTGQTIADSYDQLLIVGAADGISATLQAVESADTGGSSSALKIATNKIEVIPGSDDANAFEVSNAAGTAILTINSSTTSASLVQTVTTATSTPKALFIDTNTSGVAAQNSVGMHLDFDRTVAGSGTAAHNDIGIDLDVNSASLGTSSVIGMDIDVVGATGGTHTATGLTVDVGSSDTNYAALFNGGNVGIGTTAPAGKLEIHSSGTSSYPFLIDSTGVDAWGMYVLEDGSSNYSIYMRDGSGNTDILLDTAGVSYFNGGNVGIGTASPNSKLSIVGAGDNESGISNNRDNYAIGLTTASTENNFANSIGWSESETDNITSAIGNVDLGTSGGPTGLWFATGTTSSLVERMRITHEGKFGIGETSPSTVLHIKGEDDEAYAGVGLLMLQTTYASGTTRVIQTFYDDGGTHCGEISIHRTNHTTAYGTSSDYRLKENEVAISDGLTRINQLKPYKFNFKSNPDKTKLDGFFAHEVSSIVPESVVGEKDAMAVNPVTGEEEISKQQIDQSKLVPLLVAAVQELSAKVTALENA